jgi:hypothetical protein
MPAFFPYGFAVFFAGMWIGVSFFLSRIAGWPPLAARYPAAAEPAGERLLWNSAQVGSVSFRSCLNMTLSAAGFYMVPSLAFRLFMPPLLIPWSDVRFEGFEKMLFLTFACFRLGGDGGPVLAVWGKTGERFLPFLSAKDRADHAAGRAYDGSLLDRRIWILMAVGAAIGLAAALAAHLAGRR